jgi:S-adenosylmethionine synthetase
LTAPQGFPPDEYAQFNENDISEEEIGRIRVKDQVTIFGFACDQTPVLMPYPIWIANKLTRRLDEVRHNKTLPSILPDGKVQVAVEFKKRRPSRIHGMSLMISQDKAGSSVRKTLYDDIMESVINPVFANAEIRPDEKTRIFVNPDGPFMGGPSHHSGLTGRKSGVDTYGEFSRHSGNALSGKDPLRIDKVGAYIARYAAKNVVAAGLARECEITLSYSIGFAHPVSLQVESFGTGTLDDGQLTDLVKKQFDFRLAGILRKFDLRNLPARNPNGYYQKLATYGHFGRDDLNPPWEATDKAGELASAK